MYKTVTTTLDFLYVTNSEKYTSILLDDMETRYKNFLLKKANFVNRIPQYMIASYIGVSAEALTRLRRTIGI
jgi:hypothetical protein